MHLTADDEFYTLGNIHDVIANALATAPHKKKSRAGGDMP